MRMEKKKFNILFSQFEKKDITLNMLPFPKSVTKKQYCINLNKYKNIFNRLYSLEKIHKVTVFYDFPCGVAMNKHFEGFCPGYFTLVVFANGESSFCRFSNTNFGNILNMDKAVLNVMNESRIKYFQSLPLNVCKKCRYYFICGGGCLIDIDKSKQRNKICLK